MMKHNKWAYVGQSVLSLWVLLTFLGSLPYKFSKSEATQHIFWTIGDWIGWFLGAGIGKWFANFAWYIIGSLELVVSIVIMTAMYFTIRKNYDKASLFFWIGWLWAFALMSWAVFFHLASPLWINVQGDGWSLFRSAVSVAIIGAGFFAYNFKTLKAKFL